MIAPTICDCGLLPLPVGTTACIDANVHHSPEVCQPCPVGAL